MGPVPLCGNTVEQKALFFSELRTRYGLHAGKKQNVSLKAAQLKKKERKTIKDFFILVVSYSGAERRPRSSAAGPVDAVLLQLRLGLSFLELDVFGELPHGPLPSGSAADVLGSVDGDRRRVGGDRAESGQVQAFDVHLVVS